MKQGELVLWCTHALWTEFGSSCWCTILEARLPNLCALQYLQCVVCIIWVGFQRSHGSRNNRDTWLCFHSSIWEICQQANYYQLHAGRELGLPQINSANIAKNKKIPIQGHAPQARISTSQTSYCGMEKCLAKGSHFANCSSPTLPSLYSNQSSFPWLILKLSPLVFKLVPSSIQFSC